jgi:hypothetical protein
VLTINSITIVDNGQKEVLGSSHLLQHRSEIEAAAQEVCIELLCVHFRKLSTKLFQLSARQMPIIFKFGMRNRRKKLQTFYKDQLQILDAYEEDAKVVKDDAEGRCF